MLVRSILKNFSDAANSVSPQLKLSEFFKTLCYSTNGVHVSAHRSHLEEVYSRILYPCISQRKSFILGESGSLKVDSVKARFHGQPSLEITDYYTALGYVLSLQQHDCRSAPEVIKLLAGYALMCSGSASVLKAPAPTIVQALWTNCQDGSNLLALGSTIFPTNGALQVRQYVRNLRNGTLDALWPGVLPENIPVVDGLWEGQSWGHCAEAHTFAALSSKFENSPATFGTLALNVALMRRQRVGIYGALTSACHDVLAADGLPSIMGILQHQGALRPMCHRCRFLSNNISASIVDFGDLPVDSMHVIEGITSS